MGNAFDKAVSEVSALPEAAQEEIGRQLLDHVEKLRALRRDIQSGLDSLASEGGRKLDIETVIQRANTGYAKR